MSPPGSFQAAWHPQALAPVQDGCFCDNWNPVTGAVP
jgi:hypothetical protein